MTELLNKINKYGIKKTGGTLSLIIENDGSGILIPNAFDMDKLEPVFSFDSLKELEDEIS